MNTPTAGERTSNKAEAKRARTRRPLALLTSFNGSLFDEEGKKRRINYLFLLYSLTALAIVFWVPYFIPMAPTASVSYHFGYNNRAGIAFLTLFLGVGAIWTHGMNFPFLSADRSKSVPPRILWTTLLAVLLGCMAMYAFAGRFGGFGESSYEIDRVWMLSQGKTPYIDFEWPFGASFLYVPLFLSHFSSLGVIRACYIFWALNFLIGTCLLFAVVNMINYPSSKKTAIFLLMMGAAYPAIINMGTHYALLRHICPIFFILLVQRVITRRRTHWRINALLLAVFLTAILLLISPETAVAHGFACVCVFLLDGMEEGKRSTLLSIAGLILAFAVLFGAAARLHVLDTMRASGGGADSFPIVPAPHILLFITGLFLSACYVYRRFVDLTNSDNTIGLVAYSLPMLAASLGRCDPGHVFMNGAGIFLSCLFYVSNYEVAWEWLRAAFLCFILIIPTITGLWHYRILLGNVCLNTIQEEGNSTTGAKVASFVQLHIAPHLDEVKRAKLEKRLEIIRLHSGTPISPSLSANHPEWQGEFAAPFGYRPSHIGTYLSNRVDYGFYEGLENANTPAAVQRRIYDLARHPEEALLVQETFDDQCVVNASEERQMVSNLFFFPYRARAVHLHSVYQPICDYIHNRYQLASDSAPVTDSYRVWVVRQENGNKRSPAGTILAK